MMIFTLENKMSTSTTEVTPAGLVQETTTTATTKTIKSTSAPQMSVKDKLLRLRRQIALENELSSAADESENLGIEQVSIRLNIFFLEYSSFGFLISFDSMNS